MTEKERVLAALNHQTPDKIPIDLGGTAVTGIHVSCVGGLRDYYGLEQRLVKVHEPYQMLGWIDEDLKEAMGIDVDGVVPRKTLFGFPNERWKSWRMPDGLEVLVSEQFVTSVNEDGDTLIYPEGDMSAPASGRFPKDGYFFDSIVRQEPIDEDKLDPKDNLEEFGPISEDELQHIQRSVAETSATGRAVIANFPGTAFGDIALVPAPFLKHPKGIRDVAEWYISTSMRRDYIHQVFSKQCEFALANLEKIHDRIGEAIDVVFLCGTDFGTQVSTFCSVETFRQLWFPYYKKMNDWIHHHTGWKTFKHCCGSVERFMPSFIEAGFDILNPVQCSAVGMEASHLKSAFGDQLVFWGGGVDTQRVLPFGRPDDVRRQVFERCEIFSRDGGFVFNTVHNIQAKTPIENIIAMIDAVHEFNGDRYTAGSPTRSIY
ncbi:MAG TPA: uroporphyrinogen decarboxylase family protein [Acidobacteriota bacterium]|nr:uroporphyrinogen decarboxylase family protein [Acidobacteriota bacterium]